MVVDFSLRREGFGQSIPTSGHRRSRAIEASRPTHSAQPALYPYNLRFARPVPAAEREKAAPSQKKHHNESHGKFGVVG